MTDFDPGPVTGAFKTLAATYPDEAAYPFKDFRVEWGPIFHRGRLDGTARVLVIGQDPDDPPVAAHRNQWIDAVMAPGKVEAVVTLGQMATSPGGCRFAWSCGCCERTGGFP